MRALERLNGMYAFVALDVSTGEFLAARDPFGVKPLYVVQAGQSFVFCSEMRPLLDTIEAHQVMLLPPGYALSRKTCARFKSPVFPRADVPTDASPEALDYILSEAVRMRLPPDLPVAMLFSGGIDSTLIAHYTRQFRPEAPGYFVGSVQAPDFRYAADYAAQTGFDLRIVPFDPDSDAVFDAIDRRRRGHQILRAEFGARRGLLADGGRAHARGRLPRGAVRGGRGRTVLRLRAARDRLRRRRRGGRRHPRRMPRTDAPRQPAARRSLRHAPSGGDARAVSRPGRGQLCARPRRRRRWCAT